MRILAGTKEAVAYLARKEGRTSALKTAIAANSTVPEATSTTTTTGGGGGGGGGIGGPGGSVKHA